MKYLEFGLVSVLVNLISLISLICAFVLIWYDKSHWGWFIFLAIISGQSISTDKTDKDDK